MIIGRGGQGVLLLGKLLGHAASKYANLYAVILESYAAETRGGESRTDVVIASSMEEIPYVKVLNPDIAIFMYPYNIEKYKPLLKPTSLVILDEEYVDPGLFKNYKAISARFSEIARKTAGSARVANIVILGRLIRETNIISLEHAKEAIKDLIPGNWIEVNIKALEAGYNSL